MPNTIIVARDGPIATVTLNNPAKRNALTKAAWVRLAEIMGDLSAEEDLRCVVVCGAGNEAFAAGADISEFPSERANAVQAKSYGEAVSDAIHAILECLVARPTEYGPNQTKDLKSEYEFNIVAESFVDLADKLGC